VDTLASREVDGLDRPGCDRSPPSSRGRPHPVLAAMHKGVMAITHLAFYAGWPNAMTAVTLLKAIADERAGADA
jgi:hypothetical protein